MDQRPRHNYWSKIWSDDHKRHYYNNPATGQSSWEPPPGYQPSASAPRGPVTTGAGGEISINPLNQSTFDQAPVTTGGGVQGTASPPASRGAVGAPRPESEVEQPSTSAPSGALAPLSRAAAVFSAVDTDHSGTISFIEFSVRSKPLDGPATCNFVIHTSLSSSMPLPFILLGVFTEMTLPTSRPMTRCGGCGTSSAPTTHSETAR
jgi:hypothetical protein